MTIKGDNTAKAEKKEILISKIKKLLALTESNFDGEAEAAILKAQELLLKYNLTMQDVTDQKFISNVTENILEYKNPPWWYKNLISILANNFRCECLTTNFAKSRQKHFVLIGREHDVEIACEVFKYAVILIKHNSKPFTKQGTRHQNMYISGFLNGLIDKFKEQIRLNTKNVA